MSTTHFQPATPADSDAIIALLASEGLPTADLESSAVLLIAAVSGQRCIGCVGLQPLGEVGIIRSLAVARDRRGAGIGRTLVAHAQALASARGIRTLYLLTSHAKDFWARSGYLVAARGSAPPEVQQSAEFSSLCPDTAICMKRDLRLTG